MTHEGEHLTYGRLNEEANRLARLLVERGAGPGRVVALALPRGPRLLPAAAGGRSRPAPRTCRWTQGTRPSDCVW